MWLEKLTPTAALASQTVLGLAPELSFSYVVLHWFCSGYSPSSSYLEQDPEGGLGFNTGLAIVYPAALEQAGFPETAIEAWGGQAATLADQDLVNHFIVRSDRGFRVGFFSTCFGSCKFANRSLNVPRMVNAMYNRYRADGIFSSRPQTARVCWVQRNTATQSYRLSTPHLRHVFRLLVSTGTLVCANLFRFFSRLNENADLC